MNIIEIKNYNLKILANFIVEDLPSSFRYFSSRSIDITRNHVLTIVGLVDDLPIAYGHIDHENNINWLGICVLERCQGNGYGKKILNHLINYIYSNNISNIQLSVDIDNYIAINLYLKNRFKFKQIYKTNYIMTLNKSIELPVSMGEALDKLTILDIKMKKITDERKTDVEKEFLLLNSQLNEYKNKYRFFYNILMNINENIWDMQDLFRESNNPEEQNILCRKIIRENDNRFRVKKKINTISMSNLKEQKGYKPKTAFVLTHLGLGDNILVIGAVRYLSTCYDKVYVVCKEHNKKNLELFYADDETIIIYPVNNDIDISPNLGCSYPKFKQITNGMNLYLAGTHILNKQYHPMVELPFNFYKDMELDIKYFWDYYHINLSKKSNELFNKLNPDQKYIFVHNSCSAGEVFSIKSVEDKFKFSRDNILIVNPCINVYNNEHPFFVLAESFLGHLLGDYTVLIINANKIIMSDSSFFCLSINLPIKTEECYVKSVDNRNYEHLYKNKIWKKF